MFRRALRLATALNLTFAGAVVLAEPHNIILFVPDGLRSEMVTPEQAPAMAALARAGVSFKDSHSLFPTFTTPNASGLATGHYLGDTGDFSNTIYSGFPVQAANGSVTPFIENDTILGELDQHFGGDYLDETSVLEQAARQGFSTAVVGKLGPALIFSHTMRDGRQTIILDDRTGRSDGVTLPSWLAESMTMHDITVATPSRGDNGLPDTKVADTQQLTYFTKVITTLILPKFKQETKPFLLVYWSRDPDGTQHNQADGGTSLTPGINGPTSLAAIRNADDQVARLRESLVALGLDKTTDIIIAADHGFSTISKQSTSSGAAQGSYQDVPPGFLPPGFLALDLAAALDLPLFDPDAENAKVQPGHHSKAGNGLLGPDPAHPALVIAANGGSDLIYLPDSPGSDKPALAARTMTALLRQDYVSGLFVDEKLGSFAGALPLSAINLAGQAVTPVPAIVVNFKSTGTGCANPTLCSAEIADSALHQGQGMHGSFGRGDTFNFMAAIGPDFKAGFKDSAPVSNADVGQTIAKLLGLKLANHGKLLGRVMSEALTDSAGGGPTPPAKSLVLRSKPTGDGIETVLRLQQVGDQRYFDAAGFPGRTVGLIASSTSP
jgi:arylsulfatase A-like enzyme